MLQTRYIVTLSCGCKSGPESALPLFAPNPGQRRMCWTLGHGYVTITDVVVVEKEIPMTKGGKPARRMP